MSLIERYKGAESEWRTMYREQTRTVVEKTNDPYTKELLAEMLAFEKQIIVENDVVLIVEEL